MTAREAAAHRILELCMEKNLAINALANVSGVPPSTIYSILNNKSKNPGISSINKLCNGLEISLKEFFDSALFEDLDMEIC